MCFDCFDTARTIGTSFVYCRLDYCNSMYYCLTKAQLNRLRQQIHNALARAGVAAPRSSNPDHILRFLHWLEVQERIKYKFISATYLSFSSLLLHCAISSQYSLLDPLDHLHWSFSSNHQFTLISRSQIALFGMLHLTCEASFFPLFASAGCVITQLFPSSCFDPGSVVDIK